MSAVPVECPICRQPLPLGEPVAFKDKHQVIHVRCYRPAPPAKMPRSRTSRGFTPHVVSVRAGP